MSEGTGRQVHESKDNSPQIFGGLFDHEWQICPISSPCLRFHEFVGFRIGHISLAIINMMTLDHCPPVHSTKHEERGLRGSGRINAVTYYGKGARNCISNSAQVTILSKPSSLSPSCLHQSLSYILLGWCNSSLVSQ